VWQVLNCGDQRNPDNLQTELVNNAIAAGKSEKDIMSKLLWFVERKGCRQQAYPGRTESL